MGADVPVVKYGDDSVFWRKLWLAEQSVLRGAQIAVCAPFTHPGASAETPTPNERHYAPSEVAEFLQFNVETVRRLFKDEPGVVVLQAPFKKGIRPYKTIRIPQSVLERVHKRLQR